MTWIRNRIHFFQCGSRLNVFDAKNVFYRGQIPSLINVMILRKPDTVVRCHWHCPFLLFIQGSIEKNNSSIRILNVCLDASPLYGTPGLSPTPEIGIFDFEYPSQLHICILVEQGWSHK